MDSELVIRKKIDLYATKLKNLNSNEKRIKKRILQTLGKLKKQLSAMGTPSRSDADMESYDKSDINNSQAKESMIIASNNPIQESNMNQSFQFLSKKQMKMKLKLLNQELSHFAQKKQLNLAKKRLRQSLNKGIQLDIHSYANLINAYVRCSDIYGNKSI
jgi:hypothetical protein